jgi:tetratricopeptide (TPR) repeat protein
MVYDSRRLDPEGQSFVFRAEAAGTYALKFYKQDFVRDYILNDHVQVIVGEVPESAGAGWFNPPLDRGRVSAEPRWPASLEEAEIARQGGRPEAAPRPAVEGGAPETVPPSGRGEPAGGRPGSGVSPRGPAGTVSGGENSAVSSTERPGSSPVPAAVQPPVPPGGTETGGSPVPGPSATAVPPAVRVPEPPLDGPPEVFLEKARTEFEAGRVASAISLLDRFRERYPSGSDEAYWLYGQFYEANSPSKDILRALDYYRRLVREYPQSGRYNDARRRIAYLERFYINIR